MAFHAMLLPEIEEAGETIVVGGDEARHAARSKRLRPGEGVLVLNGRGLAIDTEAMDVGREVVLAVRGARRVDPVRPAVHVYAASPKGPRLGDMVDALSQAGAASFTPLATAYAKRDPSEKRMDRLERVAAEAAKQARRAWLLEIRPGVALDAALEPREGERVVLADASGKAYEARDAGASGSPESIRLLIGPEGGWRAEELDRARRRGAAIASFGPHVMRIETAACAATAVILAAHGASPDPLAR